MLFAFFKPNYAALAKTGGIYSAWHENEARRIGATIQQAHDERAARFEHIDAAARETGRRYATGQGATLPTGGVDVARSRISAARPRIPTTFAREAA